MDTHVRRNPCEPRGSLPFLEPGNREERVFALIGGRVLSAPTGVAPELPPGAVDGELARALSSSGFRLHHRFAAPPAVTVGELRVFALCGAEASELALPAR